MKLDAAGKLFITNNEGIRYTAYKDSKGIWTTGIGHMIKQDEQYLINKKLSRAEVDGLFDNDVKPLEEFVNSLTAVWEFVSQGQFNALCDFCFQYGTRIKYRFPRIYMIMLAGNIEEIERGLLRFVNVTAGSGDGLLKSRRNREIKLLRN